MFEIAEENKNIKTVRVSLSHEEIEKTRDEIYDKISKDIKVKGFRAGMVPRNMLNTVIGIDHINEMIKERIAEMAYDILVEDESFEDMKPMLPPDLKSVELGGTAEVLFDVYTFPKVEIDSMDNVEISVPKYASDEQIEEDVDHAIEDLREDKAILIPEKEDHSVEIGDRVEIDYTVVGKSAEKENIELTVKTPNEGSIFSFLIGKYVGDEFDFTNESENTGNINTLHVKINKIYSRQLPELNDEFAKMVDEKFETFDALRQNFKKQILDTIDAIKISFERDYILSTLVERSHLDMADSSLDYFVQRLIEIKKEKKDYERELKEDFKGDEEKYLKSIRDGSINFIKLRSAATKIAAEKGIEVSEDEIFEEAKQRYQKANISDERLRVLIGKDEELKETIVNDIIDRKVAEELLKNAKIVEEDVKIEEGKFDTESRDKIEI